ncbi:unnamed protein product [Phytophthora fragariaefolia]|uniref:RxLR effector protein n=1 Tax=Phytophthora fragariaefolia TaxID=1490495 RepID=A0A9W7DE26_9STRA|nr:unnamed protein product [Phytophthora fragariaefolia]
MQVPTLIPQFTLGRFSQALTPSTRMRPFAILACIAIFLSSSHGFVSGAIDKQAALLAATQGHSMDAVHENKRMLRFHRTSNTEEDGEQRTLNSLHLDDMLRSESARILMFERLVKAGWTDRILHDVLNLGSFPQYTRIFHAYQNYLETFATHLISS